RDSGRAGTRHGSAILVVDDDVPELVNLPHAGLHGRDEARVHDNRAVTCRSHSLPFGQIHMLDRIEYPIAVGHCRGPRGGIGGAGTVATAEHHVNTRLQVLGGGGTSSGHVTSATTCTGGDGRNRFA